MTYRVPTCLASLQGRKQKSRSVVVTGELTLQIIDPLLDQHAMLLPFIQRLPEQFDQPMGLLPVMIISLQPGQPALLLADPLAALVDIRIGLQQMLLLKPQMGGEVRGGYRHGITYGSRLIGDI
jgi:hypothetical protein